MASDNVSTTSIGFFHFYISGGGHSGTAIVFRVGLRVVSMTFRCYVGRYIIFRPIGYWQYGGTTRRFASRCLLPSIRTATQSLVSLSRTHSTANSTPFVYRDPCQPPGNARTCSEFLYFSNLVRGRTVSECVLLHLGLNVFFDYYIWSRLYIQ